MYVNIIWLLTFFYVLRILERAFIREFESVAHLNAQSVCRFTSHERIM